MPAAGDTISSAASRCSSKIRAVEARHHDILRHATDRRARVFSTAMPIWSLLAMTASPSVLQLARLKMFHLVKIPEPAA